MLIIGHFVPSQCNIVHGDVHDEVHGEVYDAKGGHSPIAPPEENEEKKKRTSRVPALGQCSVLQIFCISTRYYIPPAGTHCMRVPHNYSDK